MWVKIRSWHVVRYAVDCGVRTLCGQTVKEPVREETFPSDEKTCESCLRLQTKRG